ncbi:MAG TPA: SDR family oxidoreductase [Bryobacteraceae bacterium]|nr:SDR family oxidoreductase [Bryobacteraceae bacterium]
MAGIKGKCVLITGAGRGIGKRLALGFSAAGARVALLARSKAELDLANLEIEHNGGNSLRLRADVRDYEQLAAAVDRMRASYGRVDVLICAAAVQGPIGPFLDCPASAWIETVSTNLIGVMNCVRTVLPGMVARRSGKIIALGGRGAADPRPNFTAYAAAKAGLTRFVETLAEEIRESNIQANVMSPGGAYTHMTDEILRAGDRAGAREHERAVEVRLTGGIAAEKQISLAKFLASDDSNHVSGKLIHVNDDWRKLYHSSVAPDLYTVRRVQRG